MKLNIQILILTATFTIISLHAMASNAQKICQTSSCFNQQVSFKSLSKNEIAQMPSEVRMKLQFKAEELAQIWGDTILEGDYYAEDETSLDQIEVAVAGQSGSAIGYRITYSSPAWDTSTCQFNFHDMSTLQTCEQGRIVESAFVQADFQQSFPDRQVEFIGSR